MNISSFCWYGKFTLKLSFHTSIYDHTWDRDFVFTISSMATLCYTYSSLSQWWEPFSSHASLCMQNSRLVFVLLSKPMTTMNVQLVCEHLLWIMGDLHMKWSVCTMCNNTPHHKNMEQWVHVWAGKGKYFYPAVVKWNILQKQW